MIAIKPINQLLQRRCFQKGRVAFIDSKLIHALIACFFFPIEALFWACCAYQNSLWSDVLDGSTAEAGFHRFMVHGMT
ncbi:hypothetical protein AL052_07390 [Pseudomonas amygdali pv. eriobotryae]|nr:hypothetical protein AL052_07390 [Pseudomonas amygdali pv. eriobotryae]